MIDYVKQIQIIQGILNEQITDCEMYDKIAEMFEQSLTAERAYSISIQKAITNLCDFKLPISKDIIK